MSSAAVLLGALRVKMPTVSWAQQVKGEAHVSPFATLSVFGSKSTNLLLSRQNVAVIGCRSSGSSLRPSGDFLHHSRVTLTTRLRCLSSTYKILQYVCYTTFTYDNFIYVRKKIVPGCHQKHVDVIAGSNLKLERSLSCY